MDTCQSSDQFQGTPPKSDVQIRGVLKRIYAVSEPPMTGQYSQGLPKPEEKRVRAAASDVGQEDVVGSSVPVQVSSQPTGPTSVYAFVLFFSVVGLIVYGILVPKRGGLGGNLRPDQLEFCRALVNLPLLARIALLVSLWALVFEPRLRAWILHLVMPDVRWLKRATSIPRAESQAK